MRDEHIFHVGLTKRYTELQDVFRIATQKSNLPPGQAGSNDESIEAVILRLTGEDGHEALFKAFGDCVDIDCSATFVTQVKILNPEGLPRYQLAFVWVFRVNRRAHFLNNRQRIGEHNRIVEAVDDESQIACLQLICGIQVNAA